MLGVQPQVVVRHVEYLARQVNELGTPSINVPDDILSKILDDGRYKNQFETGTSGGIFDPETRADAEGRGFGFTPDRPGEQRPAYGYMNIPGVDNNGYIYGNTRIQLVDTVRDRSTMTAGDSLEPLLSNKAVPASLNEPHFTSFGTRTIWAQDPGLSVLEQLENISRGSYFEIQIHGGVSVGYIQSIVFALPPESGLTAKLDRLGIPWSVE